LEKITTEVIVPDTGSLGPEPIPDEPVSGTMTMVDELKGIEFEIFCEVLLGNTKMGLSRDFMAVFTSVNYE
jgi:hypothetical protein